MDNDLEAKIERIIRKWREDHPGKQLTDAEILHGFLDDLGIEPGAKVEVANNQSSDRNVVIRLTFKPTMPKDCMTIAAEKKRKKGKKLR